MKFYFKRSFVKINMIFTACYVLVLSAGQCVASEGKALYMPTPSSLENCYLITSGQKPVDCRLLEKYSGYYKLDDGIFYHVVWSDGLYLLKNDSEVILLRQKAKDQFVYATHDGTHVIFEDKLDGIPKTLRIRIDPYDNYVVRKADGFAQIKQSAPPDQVAVRISENSARLIYEKTQDNNKKRQEKDRIRLAELVKSRAPQPHRLANEVLEKIKTFIANQIDAMGRINPYLFATGSPQNIEYLGLSPQGEQVLRVDRERGVEYWFVKLDSQNEIRSVTSSPSL